MPPKNNSTKGRHTSICNQFSTTGRCSYGSSCKFSHASPTRTGYCRSSQKITTSRSQDGLTAVDLGFIGSFFAQYPDFDYCKEDPIVEEFYRMCDSFGWEKDDEEKKAAQSGFKTAMVLTFNALYGTNINDIEAWHKLCVALDITPLPNGLKACRSAVQRVHVNLVDLVDTRGKQVEVFKTLAELQAYTIETGKFFPKQSAYAGGVLRALLREILNPHHGMH